MQMRTLGSQGPSVSALGLGLMGMTDFYANGDVDEGVAVVQRALDAGVTLLDTGDFYGMGSNELLLRRALDTPARRERAFVQVKFGAQRSPDGAFLGFDLRPAAIETALAYSLRRLGVETIDLYQPARLDPEVPIEDVVGTLARCVERGWIHHIGLSEVSADTLRKAAAVHPITAVQREYSLVARSPEDALIPELERQGAGLTAYGVLSRGLLAGRIRSAADLGEGFDYRKLLPRFQGENLAANLRLVDALVGLAEARGVTPAQLAIAWSLHKSPAVVPIVGARRRSQLDDTLAAVDVVLSADEVAALEAALPAAAVAGTRYDEHGMAIVDL
ncbi:MAG: aldo/keto reductase [Myxococcota bacterium]